MASSEVVGEFWGKEAIEENLELMFCGRILWIVEVEGFWCHALSGIILGLILG